MLGNVLIAAAAVDHDDGSGIRSHGRSIGGMAMAGRAGRQEAASERAVLLSFRLLPLRRRRRCRLAFKLSLLRIANSPLARMPAFGAPCQGRPRSASRQGRSKGSKETSLLPSVLRSLYRCVETESREMMGQE